MPLLASAFAFIVKYLIVRAVVKVLLALGFAITTFVGATELIDYAYDGIENAYGQLPSLVVTMLQILQFDYAIAILFAAFTFNISYGLATRFGPRLPNAS